MGADLLTRDALAAPDEEGDAARRPVERAYLGIRQAILDGALRPGDHLREETLAALTGTSRTPVREALRQLVAEGLARADGRHRFVSHCSYDEVVIMFDVRARLEGYAAGVAATRITPAEIDRLDDLIAQIDDVVQAPAPDGEMAFNRLNATFHATIIAATRSPQLSSLVTPAVNLPLVMIKRFLRDQTINPYRSNEQHRDIVAALRAGNAEWASTAMQGHVLSTKPLESGGRPAGAGRSEPTAPPGSGMTAASS